MKTNKLRQILFPTLAALIWGTAFVAQSVSTDHVGPFAFNAARSIIAFFVLLLVSAIFKKAKAKRGDTTSSGSRKDLIIGGVSTKAYKDKDWDVYRNHRIGFVFQSYNLIPHQTVLGNVELALTIAGVSKAERRKRAREALKKVGLEKELKRKKVEYSKVERR